MPGAREDAECPRIAGLIAFYNEAVGAIRIDGVAEPVPRTRWSRD